MVFLRPLWRRSAADFAVSDNPFLQDLFPSDVAPKNVQHIAHGPPRADSTRREESRPVVSCNQTDIIVPGVCDLV
jgi:glycerate-2-kinase